MPCTIATLLKGKQMIKLRLIPTLLLISVIVLSSCGGGEPSPTPTLSVEEVQTQAVGTFSADLTQTALAAPSDTPVPTLTAAPTFPPLATGTAGTPLAAPTSSGGSTTTSCYGLTFVSDVTIPDNTQMTAGKTFTKTWKVLNAGSCAWDAGFKFALTGGNAMGGTTVTLPTSVASGAQYDISVSMTAPSTSGTSQGNWRMSTAGGEFFGNEVYVIISVGGSAATATTGAATSTSEPPTATTEPASE
jgi:hypothetical protein